MLTSDSPAKEARSPRVIIVGAGLAGISAGVALKQQLGFTNFTIYEQADNVGGTWRDNTYPGCGSDVPGHWYSLSTELNPNWASYFVTQPEIQEYWQGIFHKHGLEAHTKLCTTFEEAEWDSERQLYRVRLRQRAVGRTYGDDVKDEGVLIEEEAEGLIMAIGGFMSPMYPKDLPGAEQFQGAIWHSARWNHTFDLKGKRVGVIGNGCSAAQFVPKISEDPSVKVTNFCRTPQWFVPQGNYRYPGWAKWLFAHVPVVMRFYRNFIMTRADFSFLLFRKANTLVQNLVRKRCTDYIKHKAPKDAVERLIPNYPPGCKRIIVNPGYLDALNRPNVKLNWDGIESIVEEGIKLKTGEVIPLDVIIFGTGYSIEPANLRLIGSNGITMQEYYKSQGGITAYLGTCIPGFPNVFTLLGPNTATGHASVIFTEEVQINLAVQLLRPVIEGKAKSFEVTQASLDKYDSWLQGRLADSVWTECNSYYRQDSDTKPRIVVTFPGPVSLFWWMARKPRWGEFKAVGADAWFSTLKHQKRRSLAVTGLLLSSVLALGFYWPQVAPTLFAGLSGAAQALKSFLH
ncbi:hypothetical protein HGRIS_010007 [Hohenbuehelia grisea]|uniref:FAD/NAD(P)-binding domain-containing protein n=1 Tax=Hohenbuehelia grisea TaxID=104357 RepID=A0ABR3J308_9AGAR